MNNIPFLHMDWEAVRAALWARLQEPLAQRKLVLVIVSVALLLDNMLYMVIVPIIPDYLRYIETGYEATPPPVVYINGTAQPVKHDHHGQDQATGVLFASKAIVQLMVNPFSGALIDKIGYDIPMMIGLGIMFLSTAVFACGRSYGLLFLARSMQGVGSAFADTAGLGMIADRFTEENERSKALGIALAFISFGCLVAPPFGGALYQFAGKEVPFLILAFVSLIDGFMLLLVMKPIKEQIRDKRVQDTPTIPIWRLMMDPYIAVCAGALTMSNVALAFLEPTISLWMEDNLTTDNWKIGMIWLPAFFPHVLGVIITVKVAKRYPQHQWLLAAGGLTLEGLCCFIVPFCSSYKTLMIPICGICFGIALIDTALLPTLGYLVDVRYVSVYGSIYAIVDISYSVAYAIGPIIAGGIVETIGFVALNFIIAFSNLLYAPMLTYIKNIYDFKPFESEANILMGDPPAKEYQTYTMQDQKLVSGGETRNHLEYGTLQQETSLDGPNGYQSAQPPPSRPPPVDTNPFRRPEEPVAPVSSNPFRQGWRRSILSLPKRWLGSVQPDESDVGGSSASAPPRAAGTAQRVPVDGAVTLPRLPVPPLDKTLERYVRQVSVLVPEEQLQKTKEIAAVFGSPGGRGPILQERLLKRQKEVTNWAYEWWLADMYLNNPIPLPVNSNPGMVFPPDSVPDLRSSERCRFAARMILSAVRHQEMLERGELPQERATSREKGQPLCMAQFYRLMTSSRLPGKTRDTLETIDRGSNHIVVMHKNQMYPITVRGPGAIGATEASLTSVLMAIDGDNVPTGCPLGLLTSMKRDRWAAAREVLLKDSGNCSNLKTLESALFILCLDGPLRGVRDETNMAHHMIHGGGSSANTANRWFDKTIQLVLSSDGVCGLCYEHSPSEGIAVVQLMEKMLKETAELPAEPLTLQKAQKPPALRWSFVRETQLFLDEAARDVDRLINDLDFLVYRYSGYGKEVMKKARVSPDVYIQLALQLAYQRLSGKPTATYESASIRRFALGRVDCIRSATPEAKAWIKAMLDPKRSPPECRRLFDAAAAAQTDEMVRNILGEGIDLHLLGLREAAKAAGETTPDLFKDESYRVANHFALSTSQVPTSSESYMGYGPVVPDGYGASYNPKADSVVFCLSAFYSSDATSTASFAEALGQSLDEMRELVTCQASQNA